jgi:hypothetical protein
LGEQLRLAAQLAEKSGPLLERQHSLAHQGAHFCVV